MARVLKKGPTPEELEQGRRFGLWLREARARRGFRKNRLEDDSGVSDTYIGVLENDGINNSTGEYQRPSTEIIHKLAVALDADENAGRIAAGWDAPRSVQDDLASSTQSNGLDSALGRIEAMLNDIRLAGSSPVSREPEMEYVRDSEEEELLSSYRGIVTPAGRKYALRMIKALQDDDASQSIGRRSDTNGDADNEGVE